MAAKKKTRDVEVSYTRKQFSEKLRRLADSVETGKAFRIQVGKERIYVSADATFNVEHERSKGSEELEFQLKWKPE
ncbi:MAG TPA: amphi-Trp domain-containing protein [Chitinophagales bacterium]|nr:amphi-Trp domain-containing protein [Chitinophagales bacterium]